jgi:hypothetical protein
MTNRITTLSGVMPSGKKLTDEMLQRFVLLRKWNQTRSAGELEDSL